MNNVLGPLEHYSENHCDEPTDWSIIWMPVLPVEECDDMIFCLSPLLLACLHVNNKDKRGNSFSIEWG